MHDIGAVLCSLQDSYLLVELAVKILVALLNWQNLRKETRQEKVSESDSRQASRKGQGRQERKQPKNTYLNCDHLTLYSWSRCVNLSECAAKEKQNEPRNEDRARTKRKKQRRERTQSV